LTVKQFQRFIENPIYAGINIEKWTEGKPVKEKFKGLVSIEEFNQANRGKVVIIEDEGEIKIYKNKPPKWRLRKQKENPLYPYKEQVLCPICEGTLYGSASKGRLGKYYPAYHCNRGHYFRIPVSEFMKTINNLVKDINFSKDFRTKFNEIVLEEWEKRKGETRKEAISLEKKVWLLKKEQEQITNKIKVLESEVAIRAMEKELEVKELEIIQTIQMRDKREDQEIDMQTVINYCNYYLEHFKELLFSGTNTLRDAAMFGLMFQNKPNYEELKLGTPNLSPIFVLNREFNTSKSLSVNVFEKIRTYFKGGGG